MKLPRPGFAYLFSVRGKVRIRTFVFVRIYHQIVDAVPGYGTVMPPTSDGVRTVGCSLDKLVPESGHLLALRRAVADTHKATILATELLNMHLRRTLSDPSADLACFFNGSWLLNAYNEVTSGKRKVKVVPELRQTLETCMPPFEPPDRTGIQQCLLYDARNLATVAATGVWMHFHRRVLSHVRGVFALDDAAYAALSKDERRERRLDLMQVAADLCRSPTEAHQSPPERHAWVASERSRLGIDGAVGDWSDKSMLYHLKARPHRFLRAMALMSTEREARGGRAFALYPLRRAYVPRHVRFDQKALRDLLRVGKSDYIKERAKKRKRPSEPIDDGLGLQPHVELGGTEPGVTPTSEPDRKRRSKDEMVEANRELFGGILDLRGAGVARRHLFDFAFTTDGVGARLQMRVAHRTATGGELTSMPTRGIWAIDQLKYVSRLEQLHVIGVDPGKRELVVGVDMDDPRGTSVVRYTQQQRLRDLRSRQYADEASREKPRAVTDAEAALTGFHSRSSDLESFCAYCRARHESLYACLAFYADIGHRKRRWKTSIKAQQSEERLYKRLEGVKKKGDDRPLVLAYGSWGLVAGRAGAACNRGNPPCIGVGLMRKLSRRFVVSPTPEAYTSKTCCRCLGPCGPWGEKEAEMGKKIRGLRRCTQRDCKFVPLNRDRNGAQNIGANFQRMFEDKAPIRSMSEADLAFHRATICLECSE